MSIQGRSPFHSFKSPPISPVTSRTKGIQKGSAKINLAKEIFDKVGLLKESKKTYKSRQIISAAKNDTPTVTHETDLKEAITEHAHLRIQLFYLSAMALFERALRSNGEFSEVQVKVTGATMQISQGNKQNHAAHASAAASTVDNLKELIVLQIQEEALTPMKSKLLSTMGLSDQDLKNIDQNHTDTKYVKNLIDTYWPHESLLTGSELELTLNTTNYLPGALNLGTDLSLEKKIRPLIAEMIQLVIRGQLDPMDATKAYIAAVREHFENKIKSIENQILSCSNPEKLKKLNMQLFYHKNELEGSQSIDFAHLNKGFESVQDPQKIDSVATLILLKRKS